MVLVAIAVLVLSLVAGVMSRRSWLPTLSSQPPTRHYPDDDTCTLGEGIMDQDIGNEPQFRADFTGGPGVVVYGFPAKGGLYELYPCFNVDLDFLGLDRLHPTPLPPPAKDADSRAEEDAHCRRMRQLGATYYRDLGEWELKVFESVTRGYSSAVNPLKIGWPSTGGGVWALKGPGTGVRDAAFYNALDMDERCKIIEELGGTFYADPKDCPYLDLDDD